jgi:2,5-diketo-D-gluconate reductase B
VVALPSQCFPETSGDGSANPLSRQQDTPLRCKEGVEAKGAGRPQGHLPRTCIVALCPQGCYGKRARLRKEIGLEYQIIKGEKVPSLGLGTWRLNGDECARAVERALALGYRHIDTAQIYGNEGEVGQGIQSSGVDREEVFLVTKVWTSNFSHERTIESTRESLRKLGTDYVDLLLMHWPNPSVPLEETLGAMTELQGEGSVRHVGVSNFPPSMVEEAAQHATIFCNQVEYHPYKAQDELLEQAKEMDYLLTAYSPIAKGAVLNDRTLLEIGEAHGKTPAQVALRWLIQQVKVAAIPKATSEEHLKGNVDVFDFELSDEEMERISGLRR